MNKAELKNGAVLETRNGKRYLKVDKTLLDLKMNGSCTPLDEYTEDLKHKVGIDGWDIMKVNNNVDNGEGYCNKALCDVNHFNNWTWERKEILDEEEKAYLKAVIKPFRAKVEFIMKADYGCRWFGVRISLKTSNTIVLPTFKVETNMYKCMEVNREYTLEELAL